MRLLLTRAALVAAATLTSGCLTLYGGSRQPIVVNSSPAGAQVFLDDRPVGVTPVEVTVDRGSEPVFLIRGEGFEPVELRPRRRVDGWIAVDLAVGALAFYATGGALLSGGEGGLTSPIALLAVLAGAAPALVDFNTGAAYRFTPRIDAILERPRAGRLEVPESLRADLNHWLACSAAERVQGSADAQTGSGTSRDASSTRRSPSLRDESRTAR